MVEEARLEEVASGLAAATDGWFVVNVRDAAWEAGPFGAACFFESEAAPFADLGINLRVLRSGRSSWPDHAESNQEDFLVLAGECLLQIEGEERPVLTWDFVHCPPGTEHAFVATGEPLRDPDGGRTCAGRAGASDRLPAVRPRPPARRGVEKKTTSVAEAQAGLPQWHHRRPDDWDALPWA